MKLNSVGKLGLNSPTRAFVQLHVIAAEFERLGGRIEGGTVLELGCGGGSAARSSSTASVRRRSSSSTSTRAWSSVRDVGSPGARGRAFRSGTRRDSRRPDEVFDAVFDFGAIHQIPDWPAALAEVHRVLKPLFFFEEVASPLLRWTLRFTVDGWPPSERRQFSRDSFLAELEGRGLSVGPRLASRTRLYLASGLSAGLAGDLVGVADRRATPLVSAKRRRSGLAQ
jgi:SAM-dependent methyltransferase